VVKSFANLGVVWRAVRFRWCAGLAAASLLLGAPTLAARTKPRPPDDHAHITFTGFDEQPDGASRLYVKITRPVTVQESVSGTRAEYVMVGATIPIHNNENPLITRHFGGQVVSAQLVSDRPEKPRRGKGAKAKPKPSTEPEAARLVVVTREPVKPTHRVVQNADGSAVLIVEFPKPSKPPPPEPDVIAPPKAAKASQVVPVD
jgi:hypothetical protein